MIYSYHFTTVYYCHCSVLLVTATLLLCLICELSFIMGEYRKQIVYVGLGANCGFGHPLGILQSIPYI